MRSTNGPLGHTITVSHVILVKVVLARKLGIVRTGVYVEACRRNHSSPSWEPTALFGVGLIARRCGMLSRGGRRS